MTSEIDKIKRRVHSLIEQRRKLMEELNKIDVKLSEECAFINEVLDKIS